MRCKFCSAPLPISGVVCNYCKRRNPLNSDVLKNLKILKKSQKEFSASGGEVNGRPKCPKCQIQFDSIDIGTKEPFVVQRCQQCDGIFISEGSLENISQKHIKKTKTVDYKLLRFVLDNPRQEKDNKIKLRKCPICFKMMKRKNYKVVSGIFVDQCAEHGIWLDGGELKQIFNWRHVGGGLDRDSCPDCDFLPNYDPLKSNFYDDSHRYKYALKKKDPLFDPIEDFFTWLQS